ncbi:MAG: vitamin B12-dependent ribonucleotide reductase [Actinomycetota bacterium]
MATKERDVAVRREGLAFKRHFSKEGVHPFDEVEWEVRDAVIPNYKEGGNAFEQREVEFPKPWSQNATNIVAQKYFRGPLGTPQRESSVRQMVGRVVDTITGWGQKEGYFASDADARTFSDELTHLLVKQKAAFNSPVWFNVGVEESPQCSACQPWQALVSTPAGFMPIGDIVDRELIGLEVHSSNGITRVVAVKNNGVKRVYRVLLRNGMFIEATADHLVEAVEQRRTSSSWLRVDELRPGLRLHVQPRRPSGSNQVADEMSVSEAALAGWLQADGFVGQYKRGTNRSLTIEFQLANTEEYVWIKEHLDVVFPDVHRKIRPVDGIPEYRRIRLYGERLRDFVERHGLASRRHDIRVPESLWTVPLEVVTAYLRSVFQSEGFVSTQGGSTRIGLAVISEKWTEDLQLLLLRLGIYSRRFRKLEKRENRSDLWEIDISYRSERRRFAETVGFIGWSKDAKLEESLSLNGKDCPDLREEEIVEILDLGEQKVYDIQTQSGHYLSNNVVVHNCFILSIDDTMRSILNWYGEEGIIFKGGSGSGINLSPLRSSKEQLAGGGLASGPVSFMRGADASAGTIKSGGKTRRAAKMVVLNVDHPDVRDFIWCKAVEERKARVLRDAGFDMDVDGKDAYSMQYQNANNSVRVTDEFMRAYLDDRDWKLKAVVSEKTLETVRARDLMREIAQAAWECADPGMQYDTTTNDWHTCPASGRINASNPCSEYVHLDNSACNLASLNLLKFLDEDGTFDIPSFKQAVEIVFTAQEIIVGNSSYPTEKIERNAKAFRQLGLGYANLGALLMARGLPYDSEGGWAWAAVITALMTGHAYRTSTKVAEVMGPFAGYAPNRDAMLRVVRKHRAAADEIDAELVPEGLLQAAKTAWDEAIALGEEHGYRNAQATVLAPTGTISFLLDCDTTGIEPDLALVKTKKLVGGGSMQIVNQTVPRALRRLGYGEDQVQGVVAYISEHNTVVGAPMLKEEHYPVFDCSMGERAIHYTGHVKMMAAAQPFISGAISKTVNMPEQATVEEVEQLFVDGWKLGLKAIAIYRDNCKVAQPLSAERKRVPGAKVGEPTVELPGQPIRRRLPARRPAKTFSFAVGEAEGYITAGEYESDGVGEVFLKVAKQGSTLSGVMDAFAIAVSIGLQYGVPLEAFVSKFVNMRFEPSGITNDPDIRFASSLVDYVFRRLALEYLTPEKRAGMGIQTVDERKEYANAQVNGASNGAEVTGGRGPEQARLIQLSDVPEAEAPSARELDAPLCYACGSKMQPAGSCYVCTSCGSTSGCS